MTRAKARPRPAPSPAPSAVPRLVTAEAHDPSGKVVFRLPTIGVSAAVDETEAERVIEETREAIDSARRRRARALTYERALAVICDGGEGR